MANEAKAPSNEVRFRVAYDADMKFAGVILLVAVGLLVACSGGGDSEPTATATSAMGSLDLMPDGCPLLEETESGAALGVASATGTAPQPPTNAATRCEWRSGQYVLALLVRQGTNAKSSFDNAVDGFDDVEVPGAEGRIQLGVSEPSRNYRFVALSAYDGTYYVYLSLQGTDRDDLASTELMVGLAAAVLDRLP